MLGRSYEFGFSGWDEPPFPRPRSLDNVATPFDAVVPPANENAPGAVLFELGLILATPLALAIGVTWLLNAFGIVTTF